MFGEVIQNGILTLSILLLEIAFLICFIVLIVLSKFWVQNDMQLAIINIVSFVINLAIFIPIFILTRKQYECTQMRILLFYSYLVFHTYAMNISYLIKNLKFLCFFPPFSFLILLISTILLSTSFKPFTILF